MTISRAPATQASQDPGTTTEELADTTDDEDEDDHVDRDVHSPALAVCSQDEPPDDFDDFDVPEFDLCGHSPGVRSEVSSLKRKLERERERHAYARMIRKRIYCKDGRGASHGRLRRPAATACTLT